MACSFQQRLQVNHSIPVRSKLFSILNQSPKSVLSIDFVEPPYITHASECLTQPSEDLSEPFELLTQPQEAHTTVSLKRKHAKVSQRKRKRRKLTDKEEISNVLRDVIRSVELKLKKQRKCKRKWRRLLSQLYERRKKQYQFRKLVRSKCLKYMSERKKEEKRKARELERKNRHPLQNRKYDTAKHLELHFIRLTLEPFNIPFDEEAHKVKQSIFGENYKTTCVWTGQQLKKGMSLDHMFPVRNAYGNSRDHKTGWKNGGLRGGDSEWNWLWVDKHLNSGFKVFDHSKTHGWKKNVGWQVLTPQEEAQCTPKQIDFYIKVKKWREYCHQRGARYCWKFNVAMNEELESFYNEIYVNMVDQTLGMASKHRDAILQNTAKLEY